MYRFVQSQSMVHDPRLISLMFGISAVCHLAFFIVLVLAPSWGNDRRMFLPPPHITVDLASIPAGGKLPAAGKPGPVVRPKKVAKPKTSAPVQSKPAKPPASKPAAPPQKAVSIAPKNSSKPTTAPKTKVSKKLATYKPERVRENKVERQARQNREEREKALANLEKEAANEKPVDEKDAVMERLRQALAGEEAQGQAGQEGTGVDGRNLSALDIYIMELKYYIQKNWAFSEQMAGGQNDLQALIVIEVSTEGKIKDSWYDQKSGNSFFDESAQRAVLKSDPLPPLPWAYRRPTLVVGLQFTPMGVY